MKMFTQEEDVRRPPLELKTLGDIKRFIFKINALRSKQNIHNQELGALDDEKRFLRANNNNKS